MSLRTMRYGIFSLFGTLLALSATVIAPAHAQGRLGLLPQGKYVCSLPGNANGMAWIEVPDRSFSIIGSSGYRTIEGRGTYLKEGKRVTFTRGPLHGEKLMQISAGMLQQVDSEGTLGRLRCSRTGSLDS